MKLVVILDRFFALEFTDQPKERNRGLYFLDTAFYGATEHWPQKWAATIPVFAQHLRKVHPAVGNPRSAPPSAYSGAIRTVGLLFQSGHHGKLVRLFDA
ncbi:MAG: hypothetical protein L0Z50_19205 [Verrucomicrobiales bacterium]|nr:hypothetical protein [Verrucomicrobiales bacterium]